MLPRNSCCLAVILAFLAIYSNNFGVASNKTADESGIWEKAGKMTGLLLHSCLRLCVTKSPEHFMIILQDCLKRKTLLAFNRTLSRDVIELAEGVALVRLQQENDTRYNSALEVSDNASTFQGGKLKEHDLKSQIVERLTQLCRTHVLKIQLKYLGGSEFEARHRHRRNMFSQVLMFGVVAAGVIVVPLGFQFLAILGGKALLLAKMALLLTSIQGLKKIATSKVNYGLYSYGQEPWHYDRQWPYEAEGHADLLHNYDNYHPEYLYPRQDTLPT